MDEQKKFDFTRADQRGLIRDVAIPKDGKTNPNLVKSVLFWIDDAGRSCWLSQQNLASRAGCSVRSVKKAIARLNELGLITCERGKTNEHRIVWTELEQLVRSQQQPEQKRQQIRDRSTVTDEIRQVETADNKGQVWSEKGQVMRDKGQVWSEKGQVLPTNEKNYKETPTTTR